jgi:hypothetical protein
VRKPVPNVLSVLRGLIYTPFDPRESIVKPLIELTDNELSEPVVKTIDVALNVLTTIVLYVADSNRISPVTNELTVRVLNTAFCANIVDIVAVFVVIVLNVPLRAVMLLALSELTDRELKDPFVPVKELTHRELNDPNCDAIYGVVIVLRLVIVLNCPVRLIIVFAIVALFVIVLMDAREALMNVVVNELTITELRIAFVIIAVVALSVLTIVVLKIPVGAKILTPVSVLTFKLLTDPN